MKPEKKYWLDDPRHVTWIVYALVAVCVLLVLSDLLYHRHAHFGWEGWFGFYGVYGFLSAVFLVLTAKELRKILMRKEDYYDR
jgi:uncharacterized membrane protein